jgi:phosphate transport system permease protein
MIVRAWPRVLATSLAAIPVGMLAFMIVTVVVRAMPIVTGVTDKNFVPHDWHELYTTRFSSLFLTGQANYGLVPAAWGSMMILIIALVIAVPMSIALAITAGEFGSGVAGRIIRSAVSMMAGIPPIVYALCAVVFVAPFMLPKFTGNLTYTNVQPAKVGIAANAWPPAGVQWNAGAFPWSGDGEKDSLLLGGIMLAMLAIPFMTPMIDDALRNVPRDRKEASLALGTSRWYTLMHVTFPHALAGIIGAVRLGALKILGDVMIALFVVGYAAGQLPFPLFDVFQLTTPLSSEGAGLMGDRYGPCQPSDCAAGYFCGVVLLVLALVVVLITVGMERFARRRFLA